MACFMGPQQSLRRQFGEPGGGANAKQLGMLRINLPFGFGFGTGLFIFRARKITPSREHLRSSLGPDVRVKFEIVEAVRPAT